MKNEIKERSEKWHKALNQAILPEKDYGEFTCPLCGGMAWYKIYPHPWPWDKHAKGLSGGCENNCINMRT